MGEPIRIIILKPGSMKYSNLNLLDESLGIWPWGVKGRGRHSSRLT